MTKFSGIQALCVILLISLASCGSDNSDKAPTPANASPVAPVILEGDRASIACPDSLNLDNPEGLRPIELSEIVDRTDRQYRLKSSEFYSHSKSEEGSSAIAIRTTLKPDSDPQESDSYESKVECKSITDGYRITANSGAAIAISRRNGSYQQFLAMRFSGNMNENSIYHSIEKQTGNVVTPEPPTESLGTKVSQKVFLNPQDELVIGSTIVHNSSNGHEVVVKVRSTYVPLASPVGTVTLHEWTEFVKRLQDPQSYVYLFSGEQAVMQARDLFAKRANLEEFEDLWQYLSRLQDVSSYAYIYRGARSFAVAKMLIVQPKLDLNKLRKSVQYWSRLQDTHSYRYVYEGSKAVDAALAELGIPVVATLR